MFKLNVLFHWFTVPAISERQFVFCILLHSWKRYCMMWRWTSLFTLQVSSCGHKKCSKLINLHFVQMSHKSLKKGRFPQSECLPNFELKFDFLERLKKPLTFESTLNCQQKQETETISDSLGKVKTTKPQISIPVQS